MVFFENKLSQILCSNYVEDESEFPELPTGCYKFIYLTCDKGRDATENACSGIFATVLEFFVKLEFL